VVSILFAAVGIIYSKKHQGIENYLTANRNIGVTSLTTSLVASALGAWILFGPASAATWGGIGSVIGYSLGTAFPMIALIFLGTKIRKIFPKGKTLTEFIQKKFGKNLFKLVLVLMIFYMFIFLCAEVTAISTLINYISGTSLWITALLVIVATLAYTLYGGLRVSILTDNFQFFIVLIFDGTIIKWEDISFKTIAGIDLDLDASLDVLALDSLGILYAFNSDLTIMAGFQLKMELQSPILARDLFNDEHPEIVAKSADSSSIYIFDYQGNVHYKISSNKGDELVALENINEKNSILTRSAIYQFGDATETNGNEWAFEHGNWGRSRKVKLNYTFDDSNKKSLVRSYCYPNPIRENTGTIRIETIGAERVEVNLYDLAGYYIKTWTEDLSHFGNQITEWVWDVSDVESGVYLEYVAVIGDIQDEDSLVWILNGLLVLSLEGESEIVDGHDRDNQVD